MGVGVSNPACGWTADSSAPWLTVTPSNATGNGTISLTAAGNSSASSRRARVTVGGSTAIVTQSGTVCTYSLLSPGTALPAAATSGSVNVVTATGCVWTSNSNASWISITGSGTSGAGTVDFAATANSSATPRSGTLTVAGQTYSVTQSGVPCSYALSLASAAIPADGVNNNTFSVVAGAAGCSAPAASFASWITVSTTYSGLNGTVTYSAAANPSGTSRTGIIKIAGQSFLLTQAAPSCSFTLASGGAAFGRAGGTGTISITASNSGCTPSFADGNPGMVTLGSLSGPVGNVFSLPFTVAAFGSSSSAVRLDRIRIGGRTFVVKETSW